MFRWFRRQPAPPVEQPDEGAYSTHRSRRRGLGPLPGALALSRVDAAVRKSLPQQSGIAMDGLQRGGYGGLSVGGLPDELVGWFSSQFFIGYHTCALVAQHWLIDKACTMPARDALRHGFELQVSGAGEQDVEVAERLRKINKRMRVRWNAEQFVRMGRVFGVRVAFYKVESTDPQYYEKPFNPDGITPGSYKGIVQVDPYWCIPEMDGASISDPASMHFYEPTWWSINGKRYHRSHLAIFRNSDVPDLLKPAYQYGGISVPQKIMERVYAAERTANEAPQLAMTKRLLVWTTDTATLLAESNSENLERLMSDMVRLRDNYGFKVNAEGDTMQQMETSLADLDATIMTQYQLAAAAANVPATKLLGTTPKGFNATGEYEESSYHEELETIQENDLTSFFDRHHELALRSEIEPALGLKPGSVSVDIDWAPVDSPTAKEYAEINKLKAETDAALMNAGALDGQDVRERLQGDPNSGYTDLADVEITDPLSVVTEIMGNGSPETPPALAPPGSLGEPA